MEKPDLSSSPQAEAQLRLLADFLAGHSGQLTLNLPAAMSAIAYHPAVFERLSKVFSTLTRGTERLHTYSPHLLRDELTPNARGIAVGPADAGPEAAHRFYWFTTEGGIWETQRERNPHAIAKRLVMVRSWKLAETHEAAASAWAGAIFRVLLRHLGQAPGHPDAAVQMLVRRVTESPTPELEEILTAYLAMGLDPAETLRFALADLKKPGVKTIRLGGDSNP